LHSKQLQSKKTKKSSKVSSSTPPNVFKTLTNVESSIGKSAVPTSFSNAEAKDETINESELQRNTNVNNERKVIRKKIRINGRPGSRKNDTKESAEPISLYGASPSNSRNSNTNIQDSSSAYGADSNTGNSRRLSSVRRKTYGSDTSLESSTSSAYGADSNTGNSRRLSSVRRKTYGSDTSLESSTSSAYGADSNTGNSRRLSSVRRKTYGSDTSLETPKSTDNNSGILTSTQRKSYGSVSSSDSSNHSQQTSSSSSSSSQAYGSESISSSFSQNAYGSDTSSQSSFSSQKTYGNSRAESSSFSQRSSATSSRRTYGNDIQTESLVVPSFSSQITQDSESTSQSKISGNNDFRNVQPKIAIVTEIIPTTPKPSRQGARKRITSRRRIVNNANAEPKIKNQTFVNSKTTSTSSARGNSNTSRRKVLKKVTKLSKTDVANDQSVPQVSEFFTPPPPLSTATSSSADMVSSNTLNIPGLPPGLKLRVVGTSIKSSSSTSTSSSSSKNSSSNIKFGNTSIGRKETKSTKNGLTDLEIEALSALAKVNTGFSIPGQGRSLRRTRQRQNSKVPSIS